LGYSREKIWFVQLEGRKEGPFSELDLKNDYRLTPDTLVWREGFARWLPIRKIPELKKIFEDEEISEQDDDESKSLSKLSNKEEMVLAIKEQNPNFLFWFLIALVVTLYIIYQIHLH
jgi:hypothetical protein